MPRYTVKQMIQAIEGSGGLVTSVADRLKCSRTTVQSFAKKYATVRQAFADERDKIKDLAESKIYKLIKNENPTMLIFFAKTQMKDRGYVERQEITGRDGGPMDVRIEWPENGTLEDEPN